MSGFRKAFSLRVRIFIVLLGMFITTWYCYLSIGMSAFIADKDGYIRDYLLNRVDTISSSVEDQIEKTLMLHQLLQDKSLKEAEEYSKSLKLNQIARLRVTSDGIFRLVDTYGDEEGTFLHYLDQFGWDANKFKNQSVLVRKTGSTGLIIGDLVQGHSDHDAILYMTSLTMHLKAREAVSSLQLDLLDPLGNSTVVLKPKNSETISVQSADLIRFVLNENRTSGVTRWSTSHDTFLLGYRKLIHNELIVIGMLPEKDLISVAKKITFRSVVIGIGILLMAGGVCILILGDVVGSLRTITSIIEQYKSGEKSARIQTQNLGNDEIGTLATTFNIMAEKLDEMMDNVASEVKGKYESDARRTVEEKFMPLIPLETSRVQVAGKSLVSNDYGGDWWFRETVNDSVIVIVGKIEARGCMAAMIATSAQAAIRAYLNERLLIENEPPSLVQLANHLNEAIYNLTHGKNRMNCFLVQIDTVTGVMEMINAGSPAPYLYRPSVGSKSIEVSKKFKQLQGRQYTPFGIQKNISLEVDSVRLFPGDRIFWHTSGLLTVPNVQGQVWQMDHVLSSLFECFEAYGEKTEKVSNGIMDLAKEYYAIISENPPDDISLVVATVPSRAKFKNKKEAA